MKYADHLWHDRLVIARGPLTGAKIIPPVVTEERSRLSLKLTRFFDALVKESATVGFKEMDDFLLTMATVNGVEVTFGAWNGTQSVEGCLWLDSVMSEVVTFGSPKVQVLSLVHILVNKFLQRLREKKPFRLNNNISYFKLAFEK